MQVVIVQVSRCTSVEFEVSSCDVKDLRDFIAFSCSIVVYRFTVVNDAMEFQTNIDQIVHHLLTQSYLALGQKVPHTQTANHLI